MARGAVDFVVIGTGAAGGVVAKELAQAGFRIVVLEQGPYLRERDFRHDEVWALPGHGLTNDPRLQPNTLRMSESETAVQTQAIRYGRAVGGGSIHFTGNYWRFREIDFMERSRTGGFQGTGLEDWPITYSELEPYYTKAEWELGISGPAGVVHLLGTCRMGNDPRRSVVDRFHRTHDVPNLFLVDGSSLVTGGRGQPTCTIQALAFRAGHEIACLAREGALGWSLIGLRASAVKNESCLD
jgi:choline dehydrogenase-like flavoprotein